MSFIDHIAAPFLQLMVAIACGAFLGAEREVRRHCAGLRTMILISLGCCLFVMAGHTITFADGYQELVRIDPGRIPSYVIAGIGFLGAGPIVRRGRTASGLTTAATIWAAASLGILAGLERYDLVGIATGGILIVLRIFNPLSNYLSGGVHSGSMRLRCPADEVVLQQLCHGLSSSGYLDDMKVERLENPEQGFRIDVWYRGTDNNINEMFADIAEIPHVRADPDEQQEHRPSTIRWRPATAGDRRPDTETGGTGT